MRKGFTLIEMLIVIAVIGLLSSVLLTALGPARLSARDARIIQEVNQARAIAETLYDNYSYDKLPAISGVDAVDSLDNPDLQKLAKDIISFGGELVIKKATKPEAAFVIYSKLNAKVGDVQNPITNYYCTDSHGNTNYITEEPSSAKCL